MNKYELFYIVDDLEREDYINFLDIIKGVMQYGHLYLKSELKLSKKGDEFLVQLKPFILKHEVVKAYISGDTRYSHDEGLIEIKFLINEKTIELILHYSKSLFSWEQPSLPEDICFSNKLNGRFISIAHERTSYFQVDLSVIEKIKERASFRVLDYEQYEKIYEERENEEDE